LRGIRQGCERDCLAIHCERMGANGEEDREYGFYRGCWIVSSLVFSIFYRWKMF
jgi:hypothetical protein